MPKHAVPARLAHLRAVALDTTNGHRVVIHALLASTPQQELLFARTVQLPITLRQAARLLVQRALQAHLESPQEGPRALWVATCVGRGLMLRLAQLCARSALLGITLVLITPLLVRLVLEVNTPTLKGPAQALFAQFAFRVHMPRQGTQNALTVLLGSTRQEITTPHVLTVQLAVSQAALQMAQALFVQAVLECAPCINLVLRASIRAGPRALIVLWENILLLLVRVGVLLAPLASTLRLRRRPAPHARRVIIPPQQVWHSALLAQPAISKQARAPWLAHFATPVHTAAPPR